MASEESSSGTLMPEGIHHYDDYDHPPHEVQKYVYHRHQIWSKYDEGVWMTDDGWFGVTPEAVASRIAEDVATAPQEKNILIDAFAGTGGNTIAFALSGRWNQIFAVEKDEATLNCAKHNAEIYGVSRKITWIHGDVFEALQRRLKFVAKKAVIFGSPPWGGPDYSYYDIFDLDLMEPYTLDDMHTAFTKVASHAVLYLPRQSDIRQLARHADESRKLKVRHYCANLNSKALCVYYGDFGFE